MHFQGAEAPQREKPSLRADIPFTSTAVVKPEMQLQAGYFILNTATCPLFDADAATLSCEVGQSKGRC